MSRRTLFNFFIIIIHVTYDIPTCTYNIHTCVHAHTHTHICSSLQQEYLYGFYRDNAVCHRDDTFLWCKYMCIEKILHFLYVRTINVPSLAISNFSFLHITCSIIFTPSNAKHFDQFTSAYLIIFICPHVSHICPPTSAYTPTPLHPPFPHTLQHH